MKNMLTDYTEYSNDYEKQDSNFQLVNILYLWRKKSMVCILCQKKESSLIHQRYRKVVDWPTPNTPEVVRQFLGFVGYYRKFIKDFAKIVTLLNDVMPAPTKKWKGKNKQKFITWKWEAAEQQAFDTLREKLAIPAILGLSWL